MSQHTIDDLTRRVLSHRDERNWAQFHTPKELAVSLDDKAKRAHTTSVRGWATLPVRVS